MTAKNGAGQADKAAAEQKTAAVAAENTAKAQADAAEADRASAASDAAVDDVAARAGGDQTPERTDGAPERLEGVDASLAPYPQYEDASVDELKSLAEGRGVEINRDVEKAELIKALRTNDTDPERAARDAEDTGASAGNPYPSYDVMPLEALRELAKSRDVELSKEFLRGHLVTELRAADSGVNTGGGTTV